MTSHTVKSDPGIRAPAGYANKMHMYLAIILPLWYTPKKW